MRISLVAAVVLLAGCARETVKPPVSDDYRPPKEITASEDIPKDPRVLDREALTWDPLVCEFAVEEGPQPAITGAVSTLSPRPVTNVLLEMTVLDKAGKRLARVRTRIPRVTDAEPQLFTILAPVGAYSARIATLEGILDGKPTR